MPCSVVTKGRWRLRTAEHLARQQGTDGMRNRVVNVQQVEIVDSATSDMRVASARS